MKKKTGKTRRDNHEFFVFLKKHLKNKDFSYIMNVYINVAATYLFLTENEWF